MLQITSNEVSLTRGDSADLQVIIYDLEGNVYELQTGDILTFTMKYNCVTEDIIIQKDITSGSTIHIQPTDTNELAYGSYWFDVQLTKADSKVYTVIDPHKFNITKEVTFDE